MSKRQKKADYSSDEDSISLSDSDTETSSVSSEEANSSDEEFIDNSEPVDDSSHAQWCQRWMQESTKPQKARQQLSSDEKKKLDFYEGRVSDQGTNLKDQEWQQYYVLKSKEYEEKKADREKALENKLKSICKASLNSSRRR